MAPPSAQGQHFPPAKLLVLASQPAAPGTALQFNQKPGFAEGPTQSLAGKCFRGRKRARVWQANEQDLREYTGAGT